MCWPASCSYSRGMLKPTLKIPILVADETTSVAKMTNHRTKRSQQDFVTEIIYLPPKRNKVFTLAAIFFVYIFFAPRFFGLIDLIKQEQAGFVKYQESIEMLAKEYNVPAALVAAMIKVESDFRPDVVSPVGARGLMQVMPSTAQALNVHNINDPHENIRAGTKYIRSLLNQFRGNMTLAIASYNAGPGAVKKFGSVPPYPETRKYVQKVLHHFNQFKKNFGA